MNNRLFNGLVLLLILFAFRVLPHPPNVSPIIASALVSPLLFRSRFIGIIMILLAMFLSDIFLGFHPYQIVIYLTLVFINILAPINRNYKYFAYGAILSSLFFFLITNFAVWLSWDFYPKTIEGLIQCYILAIPFFTNTLLSTIFFTFIFLYFLNSERKFYKNLFPKST